MMRTKKKGKIVVKKISQTLKSIEKKQTKIEARFPRNMKKEKKKK